MQPHQQSLSGFIKAMLLGCVASLIAYPVLVGSVLPAPPDARWVKAILEIKDKLLGERKSPRVIFVGGSNVLFGINAREFEKATKLTAFNYGMHAGVGFEYILTQARKAVSDGDVVILSGEYGSLSPVLSRDLVTDVEAEYLLHYDRGYIFTRSPREILRIFYGLGPIGLWRELIFAGVGGDFVSINGWGDETRTDSDTVESLLKAGEVPPVPMEALSAARPYLKQFMLDMKARNVRVFFAWSSLMDDPAYHTPEYETRFLRLKTSIEDMGIPTLGEPQDFFFDPHQVYDTIFHPLNAARHARTLRLAQLLCRQDLGSMKCGAQAAR